MIASGNGRSSLRGRASRHSSTRSGRRPRANPVSRAALAARRRFTAEPLDPPAGRVSAGQEAPAVTGSIEDAGSQHGEDAAVLVVTDQGRGKGQALDAVTARRDQPPATSSAWARTSSAPDKLAPAGSVSWVRPPKAATAPGLARPHHPARVSGPCPGGPGGAPQDNQQAEKPLPIPYSVSIQWSMRRAAWARTLGSRMVLARSALPS